MNDKWNKVLELCDRDGRGGYWKQFGGVNPPWGGLGNSLHWRKLHARLSRLISIRICSLNVAVKRYSICSYLIEFMLTAPFTRFNLLLSLWTNLISETLSVKARWNICQWSHVQRDESLHVLPDSLLVQFCRTKGENWFPKPSTIWGCS